MKSRILLLHLFFCIPLFMNAQNPKTGAEWMKYAAEKLQKAQGECAKKDYEAADKSFKEALDAYDKAKKAYGNDKKSIEKVNEQIDKVKKERDRCKKWGDIHKKATAARKKCEENEFEKGKKEFDAALKLLDNYKKELEKEIGKLIAKKEKDPFLDEELKKVEAEIDALKKEKEKCNPPAAATPPEKDSPKKEESRSADINPEFAGNHPFDSGNTLFWDKIDLISPQMKLHSVTPFPWWIPATLLGVASVTTAVILLSEDEDPVIPVAPIARNDQFSVPCKMNTPIFPLANDSGEGLRITAISGAPEGWVTFNDQAMNILEAALQNFSFTYTIIDNNGAQANASVSIIVEFPPIQLQNHAFQGRPGDILTHQIFANAVCSECTVTSASAVLLYDFTWSPAGDFSFELPDVVQSQTILFNFIVTDCCLQTATAQISVTVQPDCEIEPSFAISNEECDFGNGSIEIVIDPVSNYQFQWSNGNNTALITGLSGGIYQVSISLVSNPACSEVFEVEVLSIFPELNPVDDRYQTAPNILFTGNILTNDTGSGLQVTDFEALDVLEFTILADGSFRFLADEHADDEYSSTYTVTDICGNTSTATVHFEVSKLPCDFTANITTNPADCGKANGNASVLINPAGEFYQIMWPNGSTGPSASGFTAGLFNVVIVKTEDDCVMNFDFIIDENPPAAYIQSFINSPATCLGGAQADIVLNDPMGAMMQLNVTFNNLPFLSQIVGSGAINLGEMANFLPGNYQISVVGVDCPPRCAQVLDFTITEEDLELEVMDDLADIPSGTVWNGNVLANDTGTGIRVIVFTQPASGTATIDANGIATYSPLPGFTGSVTFMYTVRDTCGQEKSGVVTINVGMVPCDFTAQFTNIPADCGKMNGAATVIIMPQGNAYIVNWPDGTQGLSNAMLFAGNYTVSITDPDAECILNFPITIPELPPVELIQQISTNPGSCLGGGLLNFTLFNPKPMDIVVEIYLDNLLRMSVPVGSLSVFSGEIESLASGTYELQVVESGCPLRCADVEAFEVGAADLPMTLTDDNYFISFGDSWQGNVLTNDSGTGLNLIDHTEPASGLLIFNTNGFGTWDPEPGFSGIVSFTYTVRDTCDQIKAAEVTIEVGLTPCDFTASLTSTPAQCGIANGSAQIMMIPFDGLYTIAWQGGQTTEFISDLNSGVYLVSVTDQLNACTKVFSIEIEETPIDMIQSISSEPGNCLGGGEIILDISNGFLPNLMVNVTELDLSIDIDLNLTEGIHQLSSFFNIFPGTYIITVNGPGFPAQCGESIQIVVTDYPLPMDLNDDSATIPFGSVWNGNVLVNDTGTNLEVAGFTGTPDGTVQIMSNGMATFIPNPGFTGTTTFQYTARDVCNQEQMATVTITVLPPPCDFTANISTTPAACGHMNGSATLVMSPTDIIYTFVWPDGSGGNSNSQLAAGSHVVSVSAFNGLCDETYEIVISQQNTTYLTGTVTTPATCAGNGDIQITIVNPFGGALVIVLTNLGNNMMNTFDFNPGTHHLGTTVNLFPGAYSIVVNEPGHPIECAQTVNVNIPEVDLPFQLQDDQATISSNETWNGNVLDNDIGTGMIVVEFTQSPNGTLSISPEGNTTFTPAVDFSGVATFTYTVSDVCNRILTANVSITVESVFCDYGVTFNVLPADCGLQNGSVTALHSPADPVLFTWSNGVNGPVNNNIASGQYMLTLNNQETGCTQEFSVEIPELAPAYIEGITISGPDCDGTVIVILNLSPIGVSFTGTLIHQDGNTAPFMTLGGSVILSDFTDLIPGNWTVSVFPSDAGPDCAESANFSVAPDPFLFFEVIEITQPSEPTAMDGGFLLLVEGSHPPFIFMVNDLVFGPFGNGLVPISGLGADIYEVTAIDVNGCQSATEIIPLLAGIQSDNEQSRVSLEFSQQPMTLAYSSLFNPIPEGIHSQFFVSSPGFQNGIRYCLFNKKWMFRTEFSYGESSAKGRQNQMIYQNSFQTRVGVGWFHNFNGNRIMAESGLAVAGSKSVLTNALSSTVFRNSVQAIYFQTEYQIKLKSGYCVFWEPQLFYSPISGEWTGMILSGFKYLFNKR